MLCHWEPCKPFPQSFEIVGCVESLCIDYLIRAESGNVTQMSRLDVDIIQQHHEIIDDIKLALPSCTTAT